MTKFINGKKKKVAIIGAGFGGIAAARKIVGSNNCEIDLIDRRNHHLFQPLLYQVAMAGLNPSDIAIPIRRLFPRQRNIRILMAEVQDVNLQNKSIQFDGDWHSYDFIIFACGSKHDYFGNTDWESFAPGLKNVEQATEIRRRVLTAVELAEKEQDPVIQKAYLTFVVVGGGPTGVELAGALAEMTRRTLRKDYHHADLKNSLIYLIEAGPRILPAFPPTLSERAEKDLADLGVKILKNTFAKDLSWHGLKAGEEAISAKTIIWAAGVKPSQLCAKIRSPKEERGRMIVEKDLSLPGHGHVFAIGDMSYVEGNDGTPLPGIAPVAIQQGNFVAKQILNDIRNKPRKHFRYWDKGMMATIGRSKAVVVSGNLKLAGFLAWFTWVFIHIVYLMRFKNRVFVFLQWVWAYFNFGSGARLIVHKHWKFYDGKKITYENQDG